MSILPSHKNGLVYLEHCRIVSADNRLTYIKKEDVIEKHFSLPHLNLMSCFLVREQVLLSPPHAWRQKIILCSLLLLVVRHRCIWRH